MNPLTRALKLAEDPQTGSAEHTAGRSSDPALAGHRLIGPIRATRDGPAPEALSPAAVVFDDAPGPEAPDGPQLAPIRATRDGPVPETRPPAAFTVGDASGTGTPDGPRLAPMRATRDDPVPETRPPAAFTVGDSFGTGTPDGARLAPMRAMKAATITDAAVPGDGFVAPEPPAPAPAALAGAPPDSAGAPSSDAGATPSVADVAMSSSGAAGHLASDAGATASVAREDFRSLRRGRGVGRFLAVALSSLAVAGAAAVGGTFLWKTELARPSLVRHLPPLPAAVMDLTPVHAANAAVGGTPEPTADAAPRTEGHPTLSAAAPKKEGHAAGSGTAMASAERRLSPAAAPRSEDSPSPSAAAPGGERHPIASAAAPSGQGRRIGLAEVPQNDARTPGSTATPSGQGHRIGLAEVPRNDARPAGSTATPSGQGHRIGPARVPRNDTRPAGSTTVSAAPAPESSSTGVPAPGASADPPGTTAEPPGTTADPPGTTAVPQETTAERATPAPDQDDAEPPSAPSSGSDARVVIRKRIRADHVAASLERAYATYLAGDVEAAGQAYRTVLGHEPRNRDARLGLAAVAARAGRWAEAADHYATLLASHPADTAARAALIAIGEKDPTRAESRLKALLRIEPEAAHLHFSLGNLYASQSRWPEAQQSWFTAYRLDRGNADHAYNLAVSLDRLSQPRSALGLYREALLLARSGPASFEAEAVRRRIRAIESRPDAGRPSHGSPLNPPLGPSRETAAAGAPHVR